MSENKLFMGDREKQRRKNLSNKFTLVNKKKLEIKQVNCGNLEQNLQS